jgi:DNA-binding response OmpR family regulator
MQQILVIDDEPRMRKLISDFLKIEMYQPIEAGDGREALQLFAANPQIILIILDVMMPGFDGWSVCRRIRRLSNIPIIIVTAREEEEDELFGFELGADEYIKKPFNPHILMARVNALLKRKEKLPVTSLKKAGSLAIDEKAHIVSIDEEIINLSPREYSLLLYLVNNEGLALSRETILQAVWNYDYAGYERTIDTHIKKLRLKLGDKKDYIQTIWNYGYRFQVTA